MFEDGLHHNSFITYLLNILKAEAGIVISTKAVCYYNTLVTDLQCKKKEVYLKVVSDFWKWESENEPKAFYQENLLFYFLHMTVNI